VTFLVGRLVGSYLRLIDFVYHSTLGLRVITTKKKGESDRERVCVVDGRHGLRGWPDFGERDGERVCLEYIRWPYVHPP